MGSTSVWNTGDLCVGVRTLIEKHGGDVAAALKALFSGSTSYEQARSMASVLAHCFKMTEAEFMICHRKWKRGQAIF
jgi:hypothetical protein